MGNSALEELLSRDYVFAVDSERTKTLVYITTKEGFDRLRGFGYHVVLVPQEDISTTLFNGTSISSYVDCERRLHVYSVVSENVLTEQQKDSIARHICQHKVLGYKAIGAVTKKYYDLFGGAIYIRFSSKVRKGGLDSITCTNISSVASGVVEVNPKSQQNLNIFKQPKEENTMAQRNKVTVSLIDNDTSLDVSKALVFETEMMTDTTCRETIIMELMISHDIKEAIVKHNSIRGKEVDLYILKTTGREVMLRPIKLRHLTLVIK